MQSLTCALAVLFMESGSLRPSAPRTKAPLRKTLLGRTNPATQINNTGPDASDVTDHKCQLQKPQPSIMKARLASSCHSLGNNIIPPVMPGWLDAGPKRDATANVSLKFSFSCVQMCAGWWKHFLTLFSSYRSVVNAGRRNGGQQDTQGTRRLGSAETPHARTPWDLANHLIISGTQFHHLS